jgi:spermidine synthase
LGLYTIPRDYYYRFSTWGILGANNVDDGPEQLDETIHGVVGRTNWGSHYYITVNRDPTARVMLRMPKLKDHNFSELRVLDPAFVPKDVLIIGAGTMMYAYGLLQYPDVETVYVAEILPKLLEWQRTLAHSEVRAMFADPRLRPIVGDGRRVIKRLLKDGKKFDLIQVFIKGNRSAGSSNVYSREFGLLLKRAMKSGGYLHTVSSGSVVKSMLSVFKYGFYTNRTLTNHAYFTDSDAHRRIAEQITVPSSLVPHYAAFSRSELRSTLKIPPSLQTLKLFEYGIGDVAKFQMTTDDYPRLEYWRLQQLVGRYDYPNAHPTPQQPPRLIRLTP